MTKLWRVLASLNKITWPRASAIITVFFHINHYVCYLRDNFLSSSCVRYAFRFAGALAELRKETISFVLLSAWNNLAPTWLSFVKFDIWILLETLSRKFKILLNMIRISLLCVKTNLDLWSYVSSVLLRMKNVSHKSRKEIQNTNFMFNFFLNLDVYKIM